MLERERALAQGFRGDGGRVGRAGVLPFFPGPRTLSPACPLLQFVSRHSPAGPRPLSGVPGVSAPRDPGLSISLRGAVLVFLELLLLSLASFKGAQECPHHHCFYIPISAQWCPGLP